MAQEAVVDSADELVAELNALGLHFVTGGEAITPARSLQPAELFAALAQQSDARLRLAIVALLLYRPELAPAVPDALTWLREPAQMTLKLFYTAAVLLQQAYADRLRRLLGQYDSLPDFFSEELGVPVTDSPLARLRRLAECHRALSGLAANWLGTYEHAAERLFKRMEREAQWAT